MNCCCITMVMNNWIINKSSLVQWTFTGRQVSGGEDHRIRLLEKPTGKYQWKRIKGKAHRSSQKSTTLSTELPTELPTKTQSMEMTTRSSTGRLLMLYSERYYWEATTSECQILMTTDMSDITRWIPIMYEASQSTLWGLGWAPAHINTFGV